MVLRFGSFAFAVAMAVTALGCGNGLSEDDAKLRCDQERAAKGSSVTDDAYDQCLTCYEDCGDDCTASGTSPATYACPAE